MKDLIGRQKEVKKLRQYNSSKKSEFIAIYERRRVGKTYLVREVFANQFAFQTTGLDKVGKKDQLRQFYTALLRYNKKNPPTKFPKTFPSH